MASRPITAEPMAAAQAGGDKHRAMIHAGLGQNVRVDEQNRRHGQKSG